VTSRKGKYVDEGAKVMFYTKHHLKGKQVSEEANCLNLNQAIQVTLQHKLSFNANYASMQAKN